MSWITPITDSAQADIINRTSRAFSNASDLNRIEGNIAWLVNELRRHSVFVDTVSETNWNQTKLPTTQDLQRIRDNINNLPVFVFAKRPDLRFTMQSISDQQLQQLHFTTVNMLEFNLQMLRHMTDRMPVVYRQASFQAGRQLFLPQRRA